MSPLLSPRTLTQGFSILSTQSRHPAGRQQWDRKDTSSALFSSFPSILSLKTSQAAHPHGQMQPSSHEREASQLFSLQPPTCSALTQMPPPVLTPASRQTLPPFEPSLVVPTGPSLSTYPLCSSRRPPCFSDQCLRQHSPELEGMTDAVRLPFTFIYGALVLQRSSLEPS